uniref:Peptidyl-prolyl cis-trans isomerase n=1 Tax=Noccaea caerulescens TaxID=107243 RepID=A0A1J3JAS4_NOCCA
MARVNPKVFFEMSVDEKPVGRIVMELFADTTPLAAENFRALCTGEKGIGQYGKPLHYKGSFIDHIAPGVMWCCGDIINGDGTGSESIYGIGFPDENFTKKHDRPGVLTMSDFGEDNNGSNFQIALKKFPILDGKQVVFGQVVDGFEVIKKIEDMVQSEDSDIPSKPVRIIDCGEIECSSQTNVDLLFVIRLGDKLRAARKKIAQYATEN